MFFEMIPFFIQNSTFKKNFVQIEINWKIVYEAETNKISIVDRNSN